MLHVWLCTINQCTVDTWAYQLQGHSAFGNPRAFEAGSILSIGVARSTIVMTAFKEHA